MSHLRDQNPSTMTDLEEGEITNEKIISQEKNIIKESTSGRLHDDPTSQNDDDSQGFFHKLKPVNKKELSVHPPNALAKKRERSPQQTLHKKPFFKRNLCQYFAKTGFCTKGNNCRFAHELEHEQGEQHAPMKKGKGDYGLKEPIINKNYKRDLCKYFLNGSCLKEDNCTFSHNVKDFPCKYYQIKGYCDNREQCKFFHRKLNKDEIMKFIKDHEQFISDIKEKDGHTKIDAHYKYFLENKEKVLSGLNGGERFVSDSNRKSMNQLGPEWMSANLLQMQQAKGMMMGVPLMYGNAIPGGPNMLPMQFYSMAMNYGLGMSGQNQFMPQQFFQFGQNNMPQGMLFEQMTQNVNEQSQSNSQPVKPPISKEISSDSNDQSSSPKTEKELQDPQLSPQSKKPQPQPPLDSHPVSNPTDELLQKLANAIKKTATSDPRLNKNK